MSDSKTLVDQLRHMVASTAGDWEYPTESKACKEVFGRECCNAYDEREIFTIIADRIEREHMPRPILEGEPLKIGDKVDGYNQNGAEVVAIMNSEMIVVRSTVKGGNGYHDEAYPLLLWSVDELKRPEPEVLDADGVPIHVGDTVYILPEFREYEGKGLEESEGKCGLFGVEPGEKLTVLEASDKRVKFDERLEPWCPPSWLTHNEPDSLERILADWDNADVEITFDAVIKRLRAIVESGQE